MLREGATPTTDAQTFPGLPGVWRPDMVYSSAELGLEGEALEAFRQHLIDNDAPIDEVEAPASDPDVRSYHGGMLSGAELPSGNADLLPRSESEVPGLSGEEAEKRLAWDSTRPRTPAELALVPSPSLAEADAQTADRLIEKMGGFEEHELRALLEDRRVTVQRAAEQELAERYAPPAEEEPQN